MNAEESTVSDAYATTVAIYCLNKEQKLQKHKQPPVFLCLQLFNVTELTSNVSAHLKGHRRVAGFQILNAEAALASAKMATR